MKNQKNVLATMVFLLSFATMGISQNLSKAEQIGYSTGNSLELDVITAAPKEVVDKLYKTFALGNIPAALATMDANVIWNEAEGNPLADGNPYVGPDAVLNGVFARLPLDFDNFKLTDIVLYEMMNNMVLATLRYNATSKHNGKLLDVQAAHLWTVKDGKISHFQQYADTYKLQSALIK